MNLRTALTLATLAGLPTAASAQSLIRVSYSWLEVNGGTTTPVLTPNSILDPGEGVRISLSLQMLINGTSAVGQTINYTPPPPPGVGTVRGFGSFVYNMRVDTNAIPELGTWGQRSISAILSTGAFTGNSLNGGSLLDSFGGSQFIIPGGSANSTNPINNAFRGVWTPSSYVLRNIHFQAEPGTAVPSGQHNSMLVAASITQPDPSDPTTWYDLLTGVYVQSDFGSGLTIPIVPAPSTALIATLAIVSWPHRRRGSAP